MARKNKKTRSPSKMPPQRILGILMLIAGIVFLSVGVNAMRYGSGSQAAAVAPMPAATWFIFGGIGLALAGFILAVIGKRRITL